MLTKILKKRIILTTAVLFALSLMYILPKEKLYTLDKVEEELVYEDENLNKEVVYLLDSNNMLGRTEVVINQNDVISKARELLEILINNDKSENKIPNGFSGLIPSDTKINSLNFDNNVIKVDFSKELLDVDIKYEEKVVEAIVYTLTSIKDVDKVILYVDGEILTKLPKSGLNLPSTLDKSYGINKKYDLTTYKDVNQVTIYYVNKYNDQTYYIPVTKYLNDDREKIKIIIEELASSSSYSSNLMSYLNSNTELLATKQDMDSLFLTFNEYIFNDINEKNILEEVIYTISLSVEANYDVKEVVFQVDNQEIYKSVIKTIENS